MPAPCKYCDSKSKQGNAFAKALSSGQTVAQAAKTAGMARSSADRHHAHIVRRATVHADEPKPALVIPPDASPLEKARIQEAWLGARLEWASRGGMTEKEMAALAGQRGAALRLLARLSGALDITERQIIDSPPFQRVMQAILEAVGDERRVLERIEKALAAFDG